MRIFFALSMAVLLFSCGEKKSECELLLEKEIDVDAIYENPNGFYRDVWKVVDCYYDSIDYDVLINLQGSIHKLIDFIDNGAPNKKMTYRDVKLFFDEIKKSEEFIDTVKSIKARNLLMPKKATIANWPEDSALICAMHFKGSALDTIKFFVAQNQDKGWTYHEVFTRLKPVIEKYFSGGVASCSKAKMVKDGLYTFDSFDDCLECSRQINKPLLLFFSGYAHVSCVKMEVELLQDETIKDFIKSNYCLVVFMVDDRKKLDEDQIVFSDYLNHNLTTVGDRYLELQVKLTKTYAQPLFVILDENGEMVSKMGFTTSYSQMRDFLMGGE